MEPSRQANARSTQKPSRVPPYGDCASAPRITPRASTASRTGILDGSGAAATAERRAQVLQGVYVHLLSRVASVAAESATPALAWKKNGYITSRP